jgi:hypothetical protein
MTEAMEAEIVNLESVLHDAHVLCRDLRTQVGTARKPHESTRRRADVADAVRSLGYAVDEINQYICEIENLLTETQEAIA